MKVLWATPYSGATRSHAFLADRYVLGLRVALCGVVSGRDGADDVRKCARCGKALERAMATHHAVMRIARGMPTGAGMYAELERRGLVELVEQNDRSRWQLTAAGYAIAERQIPLDLLKEAG